jgi:hypothetical protein
MALDAAREKARREFEEALLGTGRTLSELRDFVDRRPDLNRPTSRIPEREGVATRAAHFVWHVAALMDEEEYARNVDPQTNEKGGAPCDA